MMREVMMMGIKQWSGQFETTRTTITVPTRLLERVNAAIDRGLLPNRNVVIAAALETYLDEMERQAIDRQFEAMAGDDAYRQLNAELSDAFADADWQALSSGERQARATE